MFKTSVKDNSRLFLKLLLRQSLLSLGLVEPELALDLFAGKGELALRAYRDFRELHLVENHPKQFERLESAFESDARARLWNMDNLKFLHEKLAGLGRLSLADFDAYGSPNRQLQGFFAGYRLETPMLIFATDGGILSQVRGRGFCPDLYLAGAHIPNQDVCGPGQTGLRAAGYDPLVYRNYERLIRGFWDELSKRHNFRIELFKLLWKKGGQVAYYGLFIKPR